MIPARQFVDARLLPIFWRLLGIFVGLLSCLPLARALETVEFTRGGETRSISGRLITTAADGGVLLLAADGRIWTIQPTELKSKTQDDRPFTPLKPNELARALLPELPAGFAIHTTVHYVIAYDTTKAYAQWCGGLLERLSAAFVNHWTKLGIKLHNPEFPLVVIIFSKQETYAEFSKAELQGDARQIVAFYSLAANRVTLYDLSGAEALRRPGDQRGSPAQINAILSQPAAQPMVSTLVHEATHQIAYNSGLHQRFADIPLWVSEGIAVYFESPDLGSSKGWRTIGAVHQARLQQFQTYLPTRPRESLLTLTTDNKRFLQPTQALDAYAEAWAFNHFLLKQKPKEYAAYLQELAKKEPYLWDEPEVHLKEFKAAFGDSMELNAEFLKYVKKLK